MSLFHSLKISEVRSLLRVASCPLRSLTLLPLGPVLLYLSPAGLSSFVNHSLPSPLFFLCGSGCWQALVYPFRGSANPSKQGFRQGLGPLSGCTHTHTHIQLRKEGEMDREVSGVEEGTSSQNVLLHSSLSLYHLWAQTKVPLRLLNSFIFT